MERPEYIMQKLRQRRGLEPDDTSMDDVLKALPNEKVFDEVLTWEGLIHYGETILGWISDIFDVDLWDVPEDEK